jgi:LysM repeat protein
MAAKAEQKFQEGSKAKAVENNDAMLSSGGNNVYSNIASNNIYSSIASDNIYSGIASNNIYSGDLGLLNLAGDDPIKDLIEQYETPEAFTDPYGLAATGTDPTKEHKVAKGETLTGVAKQYGVSRNDILRANGGIDNWDNDPRRSGDKKDWLYAGETLMIPNLEKAERNSSESAYRSTKYVNSAGEVQGIEYGRLQDFSAIWVDKQTTVTLSDEELSKGGFFAYVYENNGFPGHSLVVDMDNGNVFEAQHPTVNGQIVDGKVSSDAGGPKSQVYTSNIYDSEFWQGYKFVRGELNFHIVWVPDKTALLTKAHNQAGKQYAYNVVRANCKSFCSSLLRAGGYTGYLGVINVPYDIKSGFNYSIQNIYTTTKNPLWKD